MSGGGQVATEKVRVRWCDVGVTSMCFRIHDLDGMQEILNVQAHDSDILCLEFSKPDTGEKPSQTSVGTQRSAGNSSVFEDSLNIS